MKALATGTTHIFIDAAGPLTRFDVKALLFFTAERLEAHPDVPCIAEFVENSSDFEFDIWNLLLAPKGTPEPIVARLAEEVKYALEQPDVIALAHDAGAFPWFLPMEQARELMAAEALKFEPLLVQAGLKK
jgi:tripartite-type tricarboxylate transporter receptor subunit TctC